MNQAKEKEHSSYVLAGDIGGTHARLGIFRPGEKRPSAVETDTFESGKAKGLEEIIEKMIERRPEKIEAACFGIAGPVIDGEVHTTNLPWEVSEQKLKAHFSWSHVRLLNDLAAAALAVPLLEDHELFSLNGLGFKPKRNFAVVAPGTGLGQSLLVFSEGRYVPVNSEGGHVDFAPTGKEEFGLFEYLREKFGHVSVERVASGMGLADIYNWMTSSSIHRESPRIRGEIEAHGGNPAPIITEHAIAGDDPLCSATLEQFCRTLGAVAGNVALTYLATGGLLLGGGIPPKILPFLRKSHFMQAFTNKGRFSGFLEKIPVLVILNEETALLGAAHAASEMWKREHSTR
jgi:glucokinase